MVDLTSANQPKGHGGLNPTSDEGFSYATGDSLLLEDGTSLLLLEDGVSFLLLEPQL